MAEEIIAINLTGLTELVSALKQLPERVEKKVVSFALREAAKPLLKAARKLVPVKSGLLKKSIKIRAFKKKRPGIVGFSVGGSIVNFPQGEAFYGFWQEYGWRVGKRPWRSHTSLKSLETRLAEWEGILERQRLSRKKRLQVVRFVKGFKQSIRERRNDKRRQIPGKFFIKRAYDAHKHITADTMAKLIVKGMEREATRLAKKHAKTAA
jgi:HK97 gp10 family phage protein